MEPTPRLFQCVRCYKQTMVCSKCDRGQIYCSRECAVLARIKSMKLAGARYQATFTGRRKHAARQACYRQRLCKIVTHHGSPPTSPHAPMASLKNKPNQQENGQKKSTLSCCFCARRVSEWLRHDFLRRRGLNKSSVSRARPQAP